MYRGVRIGSPYIQGCVGREDHVCALLEGPRANLEVSQPLDITHCLSAARSLSPGQAALQGRNPLLFILFLFFFGLILGHTILCWWLNPGSVFLNSYSGTPGNYEGTIWVPTK